MRALLIVFSILVLVECRTPRSRFMEPCTVGQCPDKGKGIPPPMRRRFMDSAEPMVEERNFMEPCTVGQCPRPGDRPLGRNFKEPCTAGQCPDIKKPFPPPMRRRIMDSEEPMVEERNFIRCQRHGCPAGKVCQNGRCVVASTPQAQCWSRCRFPSRCVNGQCIPPRGRKFMEPCTAGQCPRPGDGIPPPMRRRFMDSEEPMVQERNFMEPCTVGQCPDIKKPPFPPPMRKRFMDSEEPMVEERNFKEPCTSGQCPRPGDRPLMRRRFMETNYI